jgi:DNA replication protein DnaC
LGISEVLAEYDSIRQRNEKEEARRKKEAYDKTPGLSDIHKNINELQKKRISEAFSGNAETADKITDLRKKAAGLLTEAGFPADYLDPIYSCLLCRDTGLLSDSTRCECFKKRLLEDKLQEARLADSNISFEKFNARLFGDEPIENGKSQRDYMLKYKKILEEYSCSFPGCEPLLLISGATGLGKTYLAKCVMRCVIERGYMAAFYTSYRLFSLFHRDRLGENVDLSPVFEVPLLIIDDLGSEPMTQNVTKEYFFDLMNERNSLHTLIVTNLAFHEIKDRYGERIHSRLMDKDASLKILLKGKDIRYT